MWAVVPIAAVRTHGLAGLAEPTRQRWITPELAAESPQIVGAIIDRFAATDPDGYAALAAIAEQVQHGKLCVLEGRHIVNVESATAFNTALAGFLTEA